MATPKTSSGAPFIGWPGPDYPQYSTKPSPKKTAALSTSKAPKKAAIRAKPKSAVQAPRGRPGTQQVKPSPPGGRGSRSSPLGGGPANDPEFDRMMRDQAAARAASQGNMIPIVGQNPNIARSATLRRLVAQALYARMYPNRVPAPPMRLPGPSTSPLATPGWSPLNPPMRPNRPAAWPPINTG
jgi:hypothetical protein